MTQTMTTPLARATCPVCEREQAIHGFDPMAAEIVGTLVDHGYRRPGWGFIVGSCPGTGFAAYELSAEGCVAYQTGLESTITRTTARISQLRDVEAVAAETFSFTRWSPKTGEVEVKVTRAENERQWNACRENLIRRLESEVGQMQAEVDRMACRIAAWTYAPAKIVQPGEQERLAETERAMRQAERAKARAEKEYKKALTAWRFRFRLEHVYADGRVYRSGMTYTEASAKKQLKQEMRYRDAGEVVRIVELPIAHPGEAPVA